MNQPVDRPQREASAQSLVAVLTARLLTGSSATAILEDWCAERGFPDAQLRAERLPGCERPPEAAQRDHFNLAAGETVRHRRVRLVCGPYVLSMADNWYVPARLTPAMNRSLDTTEVPFGRVVNALAPTRRTLDLRTLCAVGADPEPDMALFTVTALLATPDGVPFCAVEETYFGGVLRR
ncbi:hypothetical protein [Methylobacterium gossipiicola]|uniref:Chorismate lyase n=1 Tax=Methylobacterium gossipiicola TaxID=582675 RepID=A0A1I2W6I9_9HYPH|nr:hypothetical protein [Methylobacterium gossipiicola]SFG97015.1 hypothetical protein SAMN05192565_12047 [Methylobacterium gossipiicola]